MMQALRKAIATALYKQDQNKSVPVGDTAWSEPSVMYSSSDFEKYNPDDLIGRKGAAIYKKMMRDEQVKAAVKFKRDAITSRGYTFELDYEKYGIDEDEADRRKDISSEVITKMRGSWQDALNGIMSGMQNGFSMTEKVFGQFDYMGMSYWGLEKLKLKPFDTFRFNVDEFGNIVSVIQKYSSREQEIDISKFIHFVFNPDVDEHYGQSELRECYRAWFSKDAIIKFRNMWLERHAGGFYSAKITEGNVAPGSKEYSDLQDVLANMQSSTGIILPKNIDLKGEYPTNNVAFKEAIEDQDTAIARALLVPNLLGVSPQGDTGSYSQSTSQLEAFFWTLEADAARLEDALNEQLFRQLGMVNFGEGACPVFKFKPISKTKVYELIKVWGDLVKSGAINSSEQDEAYIRELLDMPVVISDVEDGNVETVTKELTYPESATENEKRAVDGLPEIEGGDAIYKSSSEIPAIEIEQDVPAGNKPADNKPAENKPADNKPAENKPADNKPAENKPADNKPAENKPADNMPDETVAGRALVSVSAFTRAQKRVDFAVIDKTSESLIDSYTKETASIMDDIVAELIERAKKGGKPKDNVELNLTPLAVGSKLKTKLKKSVSAMLNNGYALGEKHAGNEISRAKGKDYSKRIDMKRRDFIAEEFFKITSFKVVGGMTDEAVGIVEKIILNAVKYDWDWDKTEKEIYSTFATKGMISEEQAKDALGEALNVDNPDARLRTLVRTNTFDAINTGRYDYFTDPSMDGFVTAFEYSAILDSRTTQICKYLDETNAGDHSVNWYKSNLDYRPPNHYNCRSLLIPVTAVDDDFVEGPEPTQFPQKGFGGSV